LHKASSNIPEKSHNVVIGEAPKIPFNVEEAFFPLRKNPSTENIVPSYRWRECVKKFIICLKWKTRTEYFEDLSWFAANSYGLTKRKK